MKTTLFVTNLLLLGIIVYLIWFGKEKPPAVPEKSCRDLICKDYSAIPIDGISALLAKSLSENYVNDNAKKLISKPGSFRTAMVMEDATSVWFSIETLKKFLWKIEQAACEHPCEPRPVLGVRIYYAKYPDSTGMRSEEELKPVKPEYAEHHTIFMVPTFQQGNQHVDFDPWFWGKEKCKPITFKERFDARSKDLFLTLHNKSLILSPAGFNWKDTDGDGVADLMDASLQNHGDLAPPPRGTGKFGTY